VNCVPSWWRDRVSLRMAMKSMGEVKNVLLFFWILLPEG
jgi:hypothetical protein